MRAFAAVTAGVVAAGAIAGCSAAGSEYGVNGPSYDLDGGGNGGDPAGADAMGRPDSATPMSSRDGAALDSTLADSATGESDAPTAADSASTLGPDADDGADTASPMDSGGCTSTSALLAGGSSAIFGGGSTGSGAFSVQCVTGGLTTAPALVPFGGGFQGLVTESGDAGGGNALASLSLSGTTWSMPTPLGGGADAIDGPAIAPVGTTLQAAYLNPSHFYFHAAFSGTWDMGADPVRLPNDAGAQAFGPVRAVAAGTVTDFVIAYEGSNSLPYAQTWTSSAGWDNGVALASSPVVLTSNTPLAIAPLGAGARAISSPSSWTGRGRASRTTCTSSLSSGTRG